MKNESISVVEDDGPLRIHEETHGLPGYTVDAFPSAANFLEQIALLAETACLVTDVHMPGMTGIELHKHLVDAGYAIPTILVTAYPDQDGRRRALKDESFVYLCKPLDDDHLERCLRSALESRKPHKENS